MEGRETSMWRGGRGVRGGDEGEEGRKEGGGIQGLMLFGLP